MVNYKFSLAQGDSRYINEDRELLVEFIKKYIYSPDDETISQNTLIKLTENYDELEQLNQESYFLKDLSEIVSELLEEDATPYLELSREAYSLYLKNIGKETDDKTIKEYKLKDLLKSDTYNDLIGWSSLKFGRDISFDNPNVNLPSFSYAGFVKEKNLPQYMVESVFIPVRMKVSMKSESQRDVLDKARKAYRDPDNKNDKEKMKEGIISDIVRRSTFSVSWNIKGTEKHHAEVYLPPLTPTVFQELQDAKRKQIRKENVGSGQWRMEGSDPEFTNPSTFEEQIEVDGSDLDVDIYGWLTDNFDKEVMSDALEWEIKVDGTSIEESIDGFVDKELKDTYLSGDLNNQSELDTIYAFKYKLQLLRPAVNRKEKPKMKAGQAENTTITPSKIAGYRLEDGETPIGKNDYAEKGERITIYRLKESARTQRTQDKKLKITTRIMMPEEYEQLNDAQKKQYDETTSIEYKGNYIKKGVYNRLNKQGKLDARKIEVTPEEYSRMSSLKQQGYKPISGEREVYPDTPINREKNRVGEPVEITVRARQEDEDEPEEESEDKETKVKSKKTIEEALEDAKEVLKNSRIKITRYSDRLGKFDFSPYSRQGERENEPMRELLSELRANLVSLEKIGINIEEV
tara:strand:- start:201 stop:2096 length:1896 start_codon:yes stop_codon:yes gene_type:complete